MCENLEIAKKDKGIVKRGESLRKNIEECVRTCCMASTGASRGWGRGGGGVEHCPNFERSSRKIKF